MSKGEAAVQRVKSFNEEETGGGGESGGIVETGSSGVEEILHQHQQQQTTSLRHNHHRVPKLQLEQKLPPTFSQTIHSGRSSIKPDEIRGTITTGLEGEASRAFL